MQFGLEQIIDEARNGRMFVLVDDEVDVAGETDVSIRPGWFWHPEQDESVRSVENLTELYFLSVGRNANLLLNVPPTTEGLVHATDVARLAEMTFSKASNKPTRWVIAVPRESSTCCAAPAC